MAVTRRRTKTEHSVSVTPSTTVSPVFSARASTRSTPDTSVIDEDDTVLKQNVKQNVPKTRAAATRKRVRQESSDEGQPDPVTKRGAKRRMVKQSAYVEIVTPTKVTPILHRPTTCPQTSPRVEVRKEC